MAKSKKNKQDGETPKAVKAAAPMPKGLYNSTVRKTRTELRGVGEEELGMGAEGRGLLKKVEYILSTAESNLAPGLIAFYERRVKNGDLDMDTAKDAISQMLRGYTRTFNLGRLDTTDLGKAIARERDQGTAVLIEKVLEEFEGAVSKAKRAKEEKGDETAAPLTAVQEEDYKKYQYLDRYRNVRACIPKDVLKKRTIILNKNTPVPLKVPYLLLFLALVEELKKGKGGWVDTGKLSRRKIISSPKNRDVFACLRRDLQKVLPAAEAREGFVQTGKRGEGTYRISLHPDFIECQVDLRYAVKELAEEQANRRRRYGKKG